MKESGPAPAQDLGPAAWGTIEPRFDDRRHVALVGGPAQGTSTQQRNTGPAGPTTAKPPTRTDERMNDDQTSADATTPATTSSTAADDTTPARNQNC